MNKGVLAGVVSIALFWGHCLRFPYIAKPFGGDITLDCSSLQLHHFLTACQNETLFEASIHLAY